ncbi:helix-turn-helix domain-containing protein [Amycolatopsis japonica]|uniref:helix-turn-helix domain-containing protein n=1 Tax=Amycolatopsis japonica TaxID=208439 RepID=UPI00331C6844
MIVTAYRLFERQGYDGTTTAEVSPATFFNHFATKEDLVLTEDGSRILDVLMAREACETPAGFCGGRSSRRDHERNQAIPR